MNITVIIVCLIIILILMKIFDNVKNKRTYKLLEQFPSYPSYPLIGNLYLLCGSMNDLLAKADRIVEKYDRLLFWFSSMPTICFFKHDDITTILTNSHDRYTFNFANDWIGGAILNITYKEWKKSRKILAPAFSSEMLSKYAEVFDRKSAALVESFKRLADTEEIIDVFDNLIKINVETIVENTIGVSIETIGEKGEQFGYAASETFKSLVERVITPWLHPHFIYRLYLKFSKKSIIIKHLNTLPSEILKDKLNVYRTANHQFQDVDSSKTIIDQLIKGGFQESSFTEERMKDELLHIIGAAIETTALTTSFLMLMLAIHEDIQQKVYEEITALLKDPADKLTSGHLFNDLKYLEQCIKETNRMFSPVLATVRRTHKDCVLKDNKIVPANTFVFLGLHWAQNDKEIYENPLKWDPEHFSEQAVQNRPKINNLTFGYGSRSCLGAKYAMMSIKSQITYILRNYRLSTNLKELTRKDLLVDVAIRSKIGYPIKFSTRQ